MKITIDFQGGIMDGSASLEREVVASESYSFLELVVSIVGVTSSFRYNVGHRFQVPSPGWLARSVVRETSVTQVFDSYEYEIIDREQSGDDLLILAKFVGQRPSGAVAEKA